VSVLCFLTTATERVSGKFIAGEQVRVSRAPTQSDGTVLLEPVEYARFETACIPGGMRSHPSYQGYAIEAEWPGLARDFVLAENGDQ